jgi:DNA-binding MarR family transcriptional regulator
VSHNSEWWGAVQDGGRGMTGSTGDTHGQPHDGVGGVGGVGGAGGVADRSGQAGLVPDWLGDLLGQFIRTAGLLHPDQSLLGQPVSLSEGYALAELANAEPLTQRDLAERLGLEKSTVSRLVAGLERRGLVLRRRDPDNRRYYQLTLTEDGRAAARRLVTAMWTYHARIIAGMTAAEQEALATGLSALLRVMRQ